MANTGYLRGMRCPRCKSYGPFNITFNYAVIQIHDDSGPGAVFDRECTPGSSCVCKKCGHNGDVCDFTEKGKKREGLQ